MPAFVVEVAPYPGNVPGHACGYGGSGSDQALVQQAGGGQHGRRLEVGLVHETYSWHGRLQEVFSRCLTLPHVHLALIYVANSKYVAVAAPHPGIEVLAGIGPPAYTIHTVFTVFMVK